MATAPYGIRLLVGVATVAVEETIRLPHTLVTYPMTLVSRAAHMVMRCQQSLAELVSRGDATLESLFPPKDEQPQWATFDEDIDADVDDDISEYLTTDVPADSPAEAPGSAGGSGPHPEGRQDGVRTDGRFALYSFTETDVDHALSDSKTTRTSGISGPDAGSTEVPDLVDELNYPTLTLAQLRARLNSFSIDELESLLAYEEATKKRAPFQTLLANRIARANAK